MCDCVAKVSQKGYSVFGLKFYGECWSGAQAHCTYRKFGRSTGCVNEKLKPNCLDGSTQICSGHSKQQLYVYVPANLPQPTCPTTSLVTPSTPSVTPPTPSITPTTPTVTPGNPKIKCGTVEYELRKLGCWSGRSDRNMPRAIPELLLTARDTNSNVYAGYEIDTSNYAQFLDRYVKLFVLAVNH